MRSNARYTSGIFTFEVAWLRIAHLALRAYPVYVALEECANHFARARPALRQIISRFQPGRGLGRKPTSKCACIFEIAHRALVLIIKAARTSSRISNRCTSGWRCRRRRAMARRNRIVLCRRVSMYVSVAAPHRKENGADKCRPPHGVEIGVKEACVAHTVTAQALSYAR